MKDRGAESARVGGGIRGVACFSLSSLSVCLVSLLDELSGSLFIMRRLSRCRSHNRLASVSLSLPLSPFLSLRPWAAEPGAREDHRSRVTGDRSVEWDGGSATAGINLREGVGGLHLWGKASFFLPQQGEGEKREKEVACAPHKETRRFFLRVYRFFSFYPDNRLQEFDKEDLHDRVRVSTRVFVFRRTCTLKSCVCLHASVSGTTSSFHKETTVGSFSSSLFSAIWVT